jgi:triosephosphate isomerase
MRNSLIVGNWKMNGGLAANARLLARLAGEWRAPEGRAMAVCVPAPYLAQAQALLAGSDVAWGAQDVSEHAAGAYTGEVSAAMVAEFDCRYAIVGHSERRQYHGETDAIVAAKARAALNAGLTPIACVGETLAERERGDTDAVVARQTDALIAALRSDVARAVVAYEPVWAIGTGKTATPQIAAEAHQVVRAEAAKALGREIADNMRILYGGSVKPDNAKALMSQPEIDGALVGGASLDPKSFAAIVKY